ncbi:NLRC3 [Symbiodinium sp. CCMP2456]|nr:NLRC3 [Symbiodinium sp. CCMP2456]
MVPFLSDNFDTLKDVLFGGLCWQSEDPSVQIMGVLSWLHIPVFHMFLLRKKNMLSELASHVLSVWCMPTVIRQDVTEGSVGLVSRVWNKVIPILYRQTTPTKQEMLLVENTPQALMATVYTDIALPITQILVSYVVFPKLRNAAAPWFSTKLNAAIRDGDILTMDRIWDEATRVQLQGRALVLCCQPQSHDEEADFERAPKLLAAVLDGLPIFRDMFPNREDLTGSGFYGPKLRQMDARICATPCRRKRSQRS